MPRHSYWRDWRAGAWVLGALFVPLCGGCLGFCHPIQKPLPEELDHCQSVPQACKNRVHVFIVDGIDPLDLANLQGMCEYLHSLGFIKTHFGLSYLVFDFAREIRRLHAAEPSARFVLVGFSYGTPIARDLTNDLAADGIAVDLLVYIDGVCLHQPPLDRPATALRVANILGCYRDNSIHIDGAENIDCKGVWHFGTPTHPDTLKLLTRELTEVALSVPIIEVVPPRLPPENLPPGQSGAQVLPPPQPLPSTLPPPTPTNPSNMSKTDWNFLHPDGSPAGVLGIKPMPDAWNSNLMKAPEK